MAVSFAVTAGEIDVVQTTAARLCASDALTPTNGDEYAAAAFSHKHSVLVYCCASDGAPLCLSPCP